jgi:hypothetical protein
MAFLQATRLRAMNDCAIIAKDNPDCDPQTIAMLTTEVREQLLAKSAAKEARKTRAKDRAKEFLAAVKAKNAVKAKKVANEEEHVSLAEGASDPNIKESI